METTLKGAGLNSVKSKNGNAMENPLVVPATIDQEAKPKQKRLSHRIATPQPLSGR